MIYRNKLGRFERDRVRQTLFKIYFYSSLLGLVGILSFVGSTHIANEFDRLLKVEDSQAGVEVDWQDQVRLLILNADLDVSIAETIIKRESAWNPTSIHINKNGTIDRGLWQINNVYHSEVSDICAYDPICSTKEAIRIQGKEGWNAWYGYKNVR